MFLPVPNDTVEMREAHEELFAQSALAKIARIDIALYELALTRP